MVTFQEDLTRLQFFDVVFGEGSGWLEIATKAYNSNNFMQTFFRWPQQAEEAMAFIESKQAGNNVWFCTSLLSVPKRLKGNISECTCLWADLDSCHPDNLEHPKPNIVIQSSIGRYQAIWSLDEPCPPGIAEDYSRRIAYKYAEFGADIGTWNLGRLLRVPYTNNYKYIDRKVELVTCLDLKYPIEIFADLPETDIDKIHVDLPMPDMGELPSGDVVLKHFAGFLPEFFEGLHNVPPDEDADWSERFWKELRVCFEAGMTAEDTFAVALESACNKFIRDERPPEYTWNDVTRAYAAHTQNAVTGITQWSLPTLVTPDEIPQGATFVERYVGWASQQTDAPVEYHQLSACIILSAMLSKTIRIPTSMGTLRPNLWGMILADTTLTRKTTAMDMAVDLLEEVLPDIVVATDGSVEGLLSTLSLRNGVSSMFKRDEFTGLMEQMAKKDYMSGMLEMFTQLYDGKNIKRVLKKESIEVSSPIFLMFTGGIRERMQSILTHEHVSSGFIPRFLVVAAESDISRVRPLGRRTDKSVGERNDLLKELRSLKERYVDDITIKTDAGTMLMASPEVDADLTDEAWDLYNHYEHVYLQTGITSDQKEHLTPVLDRMCKSLLKIAVISAACRQVPEHATIAVTVEDIKRAASLIQLWAVHTVDLVSRIGQSTGERSLQHVFQYVRTNEGTSRSAIMRRFHLDAFQMETIQKTLEMRGLIRVEKKGKGIHLWTA